MTLRWKPHARKILGITDLIEDADGARRMISEGDWLAVVYPSDRKTDYVETIERAQVHRAFTVIQGQNGAILFLTRVEIDASVGRLRWEAEARYEEAQHIPSTAITGAMPGTLTLPDGTLHSTGTGSGFFEAKGRVRAYAPWWDIDIDGGWTVVTEVDPRAPEEIQPLLAALPLLMFTSPPTA
ncbi:hypothetical protein EON82_09860 [bacterium]|nr:MAG: hypothetical protein EON82_09860 [bacterium]